MGQYFIAYTKHPDKARAFDAIVDGEGQGLKLTEHSWMDNPWVNAVASTIIYNPAQVAWVGDYSKSRCPEGVYELCWDNNNPEHPFTGLTEVRINWDNYFLVNHTKKQFLDMESYIDMNKEDDGWCLHPLPLLTAVGNGLGGGDYYGPNVENVGTWAFDELEIVEKSDVPTEYERKFFEFNERS